MMSLKEWLKQQSWKAKPIKALGPKAWLIGSEQKQECSFLRWNDQSILVKQIVQKSSMKMSPILAGNIPKMQNSQGNAFQKGDPFADPWANYLNSAMPNAGGSGSQVVAKNAAPVTRSVDAPIEQRFKSQDAKIDDLALQLTMLKSQQESMQSEDQNFRNQVNSFV